MSVTNNRDFIIKKGDELKHAVSNKAASRSDFYDPKNVIFVHGFTSHGEYMNELVETFYSYDYNCFIFNYNSYRGITEAAASLHDRLVDINQLDDGVLEKHPCILVCHSMGGLVGRALSKLSNANKYISKIIALGTPHKGTLNDATILHAFISWGESISSVMPGWTMKDCKSALELVGADNNKTISGLLEGTLESSCIPILSVSGGMSKLEIGKNPVYNFILNYRLRKSLGKGRNDGLVREDSADVTQLDFRGLVPDTHHINDYPDYNEINHTYLTYNQSVALKVMKWIEDK